MAAKRTATTDQSKIPQVRDSTTVSCPMNPYCAAEFAAIAANYTNLNERMDRLETKFDESIESLRHYLKEEYSQSIEFRIQALTARLESAERHIAGMQKSINDMSKRVLYASGGVAVLAFLAGIAAAVLPKLGGGL